MGVVPDAITAPAYFAEWEYTKIHTTTDRPINGMRGYALACFPLVLSARAPISSGVRPPRCLFQKRMVFGQLAGNPYRQFVFHVGNVLLVDGKRRYQLVIDQ